MRSNIRELEGSLNKVIAKANLEKAELNLSLAEKALEDIISPDKKRKATPDYILDLVCEQFEVTPEEIRSTNRSRKIAYPRQVFMYLCRSTLDIPLQTIANMLGIRNHTTIMYGVDKIDEEYRTNPKTHDTIDLLKKKILPAV